MAVTQGQAMDKLAYCNECGAVLIVPSDQFSNTCDECADLMFGPLLPVTGDRGPAHEEETCR